MRIDEIASAEDQIALFKLITDKVWQALGDQQRAEAETKAAQPLKAKLKTQAATKRSAPRRLPTIPPAVKQLPARPAQRQQPLNRTQAAQPQTSGSVEKNSMPSKKPSNGSKDAISAVDIAV